MATFRIYEDMSPEQIEYAMYLGFREERTEPAFFWDS